MIDQFFHWLTYEFFGPVTAAVIYVIAGIAAVWQGICWFVKATDDGT